MYIYIYRLRCTSNTTTCYNTVYLKLHYTILYWKILFEKKLGGCPSKSALVTGPRSHNIDIHSVCHRLEGRPYDSSVIVLLVWFNSLKSRDFSLQSFMSIWWAKTYHEASIKKQQHFLRLGICWSDDPASLGIESSADTYMPMIMDPLHTAFMSS